MIDLYSINKKFYLSISKKLKKRNFDLDKYPCVQGWVELVEEKYGHSIGERWVFDYIVYQFSYWKDEKKTTVGYIPPAWIYGKKAFERFLTRDHKKSTYFSREFIKNNNLFRLIPEKEKVIKKAKNIKVYSYLEKLRKRSSNGTEMDIECLAKQAYDSSSKHCRSCKYESFCMELKELDE